MGTTDVPNGYHGCTTWIPRVYQMDTTGVPYGYHGCTKWVPRVYQMGTTGVPNGHHGCTKWVLRVHQMNTTGVLNGYHGCSKWASGKRNGVAKRCWALWRCVFVCLRGHIRWHLRVCGEFGRSITITGQLARNRSRKSLAKLPHIPA